MKAHDIMVVHRSIPAIAALAFALLAPGAHAANASASAQISNLTYQLVDLDPNDGILPTITFATSYLGQASTSWYPYASDTSGALGSTGVTWSSGSAATSSGATALSAHSSLSSDWYSRYDADASQYLPFTLSPHTSLLITAAGALDVVPGGATRSSASISFTAQLDFLSPGGVKGGTYYDQSYASQDGARDYSFSAYLASGATAQNGFLQLRAQTSLELDAPTDPANPVPEPETWGMLLGGLAVVGGLARRRSKSAH
jgi:hypothetical protein